MIQSLPSQLSLSGAAIHNAHLTDTKIGSQETRQKPLAMTLEMAESQFRQNSTFLKNKSSNLAKKTTKKIATNVKLDLPKREIASPAIVEEITDLPGKILLT